MTWQQVITFLSRYGYAFLFVASIAENVFLLGIVVPGDLAVVFGGALAARAYLEPVRVAAVVALGVVTGACLSFWLGRRGGPSLIEWWESRFAGGRLKARFAEDYFVAHGAKTVFFASFVAGLRNAVPVVAGASGMGFWRFVMYGAAGSALRSTALVAVGYVFGANLERAARTLGSINGWAIVVFIAGGLAFFGFRRVKARRALRRAGAISKDRVNLEPSHDLGNAPTTRGHDTAPAGAKGASLTSPSSKENSQS
jgi:membrane protein DedA with SNARE-associated domain